MLSFQGEQPPKPKPVTPTEKNGKDTDGKKGLILWLNNIGKRRLEGCMHSL